MTADKNLSTSPNDDPSDDLTVIRGIGRVYTAALHSIGIHRFADLAQYTPEGLVMTLAEQAGVHVSPRLIESQNWIGQAQELASQTRNEEDFAHGEEDTPEQEDAIEALAAPKAPQWQAVSEDQKGHAAPTRTLWQTIVRWCCRVFRVQNK